MQVHERLKGERERLGLTQPFVAERLGVGKTTVINWEKGVSAPDALQLAVFSELGADVTYILTGTSTKARVAQMLTNIGARYREVRGKQSVKEFARLLGTTPEVVAAIEAGTQRPTAEMAMKLQAAHPDKPILWLLGDNSHQLDRPLTDIEGVLVTNYRDASQEGQEAVRWLAAFYAERAHKKKQASPKAAGK